MSRNALKEYYVISATRGLSIKTLTRQFDDVATAAEVEALQEMRKARKWLAWVPQSLCLQQR